MVKYLGYHDAYASACVHAIAGGTCLAVLINLGPRIGKFRADGTPRNIPPQNPWLVCIGLFLIYTGFWGFYAACNIPIFDVQAGDGVFYSATNIYLQPTIALRHHLQLHHVAVRRIDGGLHHVEGRSILDLLRRPRRRDRQLRPATTSTTRSRRCSSRAVIVVIIYKLHYWVERRFKIDDAVGAVAVHGYAGFLGVFIAGFVLWGYPSVARCVAGS